MTASSLHRSLRPIRPVPVSTPVRGVADALARAVEAPIVWLQRERDRRTLQGLDDRLLRDIGVSRGEVEHEVAKPFWRA